MKKLLVLALALLAILSAIIAFVYFTKTAGALPSYLPGYTQGSSHKHVKHGIVFAGLAVVLLIGAWMATGNSNEIAKTDNNTD